jgi:hypothetical protein
MNNEYLIGIDMGYGLFKGYSKEGWCAIRSAAANGYQISTEILLDDNEQYVGVEAIYLNDEIIAVGDQALGWLNRLDSTRTDFHRSDAAFALLQATMLEITKQTGIKPVSTKLTLALPGANFGAQKRALLKLLKNKGDVWQSRFIDKAGRERQKTFVIKDIQIILQPQGHLLGLWMTDKGGIRNQQRSLARTIVVDMGAGTCDMGVFSKFRAAGELTSPAGGWQIVRTVEKALKAELPDYNPDRFDLDAVVQGDGQVFFNGRHYDMSHIVNDALAKASSRIANHLTSTVPNALNIPNILLVGGWGERLFPYIRTHISHITLASTLYDKNGSWKNELPANMPIIALAARGCYCYMMSQEARLRRAS